MGCSEIFNPVVMSVAGNVAGRTCEELSVDWETLKFTTETRGECSEIISACLKGSYARESDITSGMYLKGVL